MKKILVEIVSDSNLAWDRSLANNKQKFFAELNSEVIQELTKRRNELDKIDANELSLFKKNILELRRKMLIEGVGLFIIDGNCLKSFSLNEKKSIYILVAKILGELLVQNIQQEKIIEVKDVGKTMKSGGRYHETKDAGSHHTDSPQWKDIPDYLGLFCVHNAKKGGTNLFLSAYTIHNRILKERKDLLNSFYENFHFDKRGEYKDGESPTVFEQIFKYEDGKLGFRYLRDYINSGHKIQNQPLSESQKEALAYLDNLMYEEDIILRYDLKPDDMVFSDNHRIVHGRTTFEDYDDENLKRCMLRTWVKDRAYGRNLDE